MKLGVHSKARSLTWWTGPSMISTVLLRVRTSLHKHVRGQRGVLLTPSYIRTSRTTTRNCWGNRHTRHISGLYITLHSGHHGNPTPFLTLLVTWWLTSNKRADNKTTPSFSFFFFNMPTVRGGHVTRDTCVNAESALTQPHIRYPGT